MSVIGLTSCGIKKEQHEGPPEKSKSFTVQLDDSIGSVTIQLPSRYDTFFSWRHYSDCGDPCDYIKYRFQPSSLSIIKESGWYWREPKDSVDRFTIQHSAYRRTGNDADSLSTAAAKGRQIDELKVSGNQILYDTTLLINNRYFGMIQRDFFDSYDSVYKQTVLAISSVNGNWVRFNFERFSKTKFIDRSFLENAEYYLKTIRIPTPGK